MGVEVKCEIFLEIYQTFINACYNDFPEYRISSLYTIGYLFDEINPKFISNEIKRNFLSSILFNIEKNNEEVLKIALNSFIKILPHLKNLFSVIEIKGQIMQRIFDIKDFEIIYKDLLLILCEISKNYYNDLNENDIQIFIEISGKSVRNYLRKA